MNLNNLIRKNIKNLKPYSSARKEFKGQADVFLDANENPFNIGFNRYPDPLQAKLKEKIASLKNIVISNIFLGNGSDEAIDLLIRIFCEPKKDNIILLPPTYGMYQVSADISDIATKKINLTKDFQPDVAQILAQADVHSKLLFICSPNNPTGNSIELKYIEQLLEQFQGIVVIDEAYIDFSDQKSCLFLLEKYPNLVVLQTFSKAWGLAAIRLGMAFSSKEIIDLFNKVKPPYNVNQLSQQTALKAIENKAQKHDWVKLILTERKSISEVLQQLDFIEKIYPSDANFLLVKMKNPTAVYHYLMEQKIIVRNRSKVTLCEGCLRITIGTKTENERLMNCLTKYQR